ncbi:MAG: spermidine/putrescine ABC transporter substrate-binding protein [Psychromonas sp.]
MWQIIPTLLSRKIKNGLLVATLVAGWLSPVYASAAESASPVEITFLTWGEYINTAVIAKFEAQYQAKVKFVYFESDGARDELMMNTEGKGYDLILLDRANILSYKKLGWITAFNREIAPNINYARLPVLANLDKTDNTDKICSPYSWGTTGIAYRKDLIAEPIRSWKEIFSPAPALHGKILMSDMANEVIGMALKSLGYSIASSNSQEIEEARQLLLAQAPLIAGYSPVASESKKAKLVTGEVSVIFTYSSDALMMKEFEPQIEYTVPAEGGAIWADFICLSATAEHAELAHHFINFINQPQQAADNALFLFSATPNSEAEKLLPAEFRNNPIIYPDAASVAQSELYMSLPPRTVKKYNSIMRELNNIFK